MPEPLRSPGETSGPGATGGGGGLPYSLAPSAYNGWTLTEFSVKGGSGVSEVAFPYSEARLAGVLGVSRGRVRYLRSQHLQENRDWQKNGAEILLSGSGLDRLCSLESAELSSMNLDQCLAQKNGAGASPETVLPVSENKKMTVVPPTPINERVVRAEDENGDRWLVDVGKNGTFVFGDEIEVGPHPSQQGIWQLMSALPRDRRRNRA